MWVLKMDNLYETINDYMIHLHEKRFSLYFARLKIVIETNNSKLIPNENNIKICLGKFSYQN